MTHYRRERTTGALWFFTTALENRNSRLLVEHIDALRNSVNAVRKRHPFTIHAWVTLPDHIHTIWSLPEADTRFGMRWGLIKAGFSRKVEVSGKHTTSLRNRRERGIWQRRFWEHRIRNEDDLRRHCDYIHYNPVKHGLVESVADWPYSSFHHFVRRDIYPTEWTRNTVHPKPDTRYGE